MINLKSPSQKIHKGANQNSNLPKNIKTILVPINSSEASVIGLKKSIQIAKNIGAKINVLYVLDMFSDSPPLSMLWYYESLKKIGNNQIRLAIDLGSKKGVEVTGKIVSGIPAVKIIEESKNFDLIVIGTKKRSIITKFFKTITYTDIVRKVKKNAFCPLFLIEISNSNYKFKEKIKQSKDNLIYPAH